MFSRNGIVYDVKRFQDEVDEHYYTRGWFIAWMEPKNINEYNEAIKLSRMLINTIVLNCKYSEANMKLFDAFLNKD